MGTISPSPAYQTREAALARPIEASGPGAGGVITDPDGELAGKARRGDRQALTALYERHKARLFGWLVRSTGNRPLAEDVFQETWMKAAHAIGSYDPALGTFRSWLFRIAGNAAVDRRRREARHDIGELDAPVSATGEPMIQTLAAVTPAPDRQAEGREFADDLERALSALNDRQRAAVLLRHQQGLSYGEIATTLNVAEGTAKTLVHRGVRILRRRLRVWDDHD